VERVRTFALAALILLGACREQRPPAPTEEQSDQLNEAEAMLNDVAQNDVAANDVPTNEEGPADRSASPSNASD
jgi:hypothetical protein